MTDIGRVFNIFVHFLPIVFYEAFGAEVTKIRANDDLSLTSLTKMTVSVHQTV